MRSRALLFGSSFLLGVAAGQSSQLQILPGIKDFLGDVEGLVEGTANDSGVKTFTCPGYKVASLKTTKTGLTARLALAAKSCNAFGTDIDDLTIQVVYETLTRLHVTVSDTDNNQYTIPEDVIERPSPPSGSLAETSDLVFNHESEPFAFWITRRSDPSATPLFDTRISSLPQSVLTPTSPNATISGFPIVFEDQFLQITSALPLNTNIYGLGEVVSTSGFRRAISGNGTLQTMWARDIADPEDQNLYGSHPVYIEHRFDQDTKKSQSQGVFLFSAAGGDILLQSPVNFDKSFIQYRMIGGILDFYFLSGPSPNDVIEQYGALVGLPTWQPAWGFGFHLCRWGYQNVTETREQVTKMREANIPLEVMWNDIDLYHAVRDFTSDPVSFPGEDMRAFIKELAGNNQHYIPIVDAAIPKQINATDIYDPYIKGVEQRVFITNPGGSEYIGQVWPGFTVFPDWFAKNTQQWWTDALRNWSTGGIEFSGIWLDMNEASSFCDGSCGTGADLSNTSVPFLLPGVPGNLITTYPECYDPDISGPSGNITVNGQLTCQSDSSLESLISLSLGIPGIRLAKRGLGAGQEKNVDLNTPPYAIHNGNGRLSIHALATNATHADGQVELDVHNMWGLMEEKATHLALQDIIPGKRPFLISRSTFPSSGKWTGHWLGDNFSLWAYLRYSIQGVLQFQIFQIPFVGADTCGFNGNTDEELCNRWMQLAAFTPFYRNHNEKGALSQEPYRWDSVAAASRTAIAVRYSLLPYWYTLFANSSLRGTPPVRALFFEFPNEEQLFGIDTQFLIGRDILVTPVLTPNVSTVDAIFPGEGSVVWRDWYTHNAVNVNPNGPTTLSAPLGHINVHVRDGSAILLHAEPAYTIEETRNGPFSLLVSQANNGNAFGTAYLDDGVSNPPGPSRVVEFAVSKQQLRISSQGSFNIAQKLQKVTILGVSARPTSVSTNGKAVASWVYTPAQQELIVTLGDADLNQSWLLQWR